MKKLIFDIGSNIGTQTDRFLQLAEKVICFEPNPSLVSFLNNKFVNNLNVIIDNRGLSDKNEQKEFFISNANTLSTFEKKWIGQSRFSKEYTWNDKCIVNTTTLDSVLEQYGIPDIIKIDVEGYELTVFKGLSKLLKKTIFAFEWAEEQYSDLQKIIFHVSEIGYNMFSFTYGDTFNTEEQLEWNNWDQLKIHQDIIPERKQQWGMVYFKYTKNVC